MDLNGTSALRSPVTRANYPATFLLSFNRFLSSYIILLLSSPATTSSHYCCFFLSFYYQTASCCICSPDTSSYSIPSPALFTPCCFLLQLQPLPLQLLPLPLQLQPLSLQLQPLPLQLQPLLNTAALQMQPPVVFALHTHAPITFPLHITSIYCFYFLK